MSQGTWVRVASGLAVAALMSTSAWAQNAPAEPNPNRGNIGLDAGVDFTTEYIFRGIVQENQGFIGQPYANINVDLFKGSDAVSSAGLVFGIWNSFHSGPTGTGGTAAVSPRAWYEADLMGGGKIDLFQNFSVAAMWVDYTSPNDLFDDVQEVDVRIGFDDTEMWKNVEALPNFMIQPYFLVAYELDGQRDGFGDRGVYGEFGITPSFVLAKVSNEYPLTISLPTTVGWSFNDYYEAPGAGDQTFGFVDFSPITVSVPLTFIPRDFGAWQAYAGLHLAWLGGNASSIATPAVIDGEQFQMYGKGGISFSY